MTALIDMVNLGIISSSYDELAIEARLRRTINPPTQLERQAERFLFKRAGRYARVEVAKLRPQERAMVLLGVI